MMPRSKKKKKKKINQGANIFFALCILDHYSVSDPLMCVMHLATMHDAATCTRQKDARHAQNALAATVFRNHVKLSISETAAATFINTNLFCCIFFAAPGHVRSGHQPSSRDPTSEKV